MTPSTTPSAIPTSLFLLDAAGELKPATTTDPDLPATVNGLPAFYFWKDAIVVGSYVHPTKKFSLQITRDKLDCYTRNFAKMKTNGVAVPILMDHTQSAAATLGWIIDVKRRDDRLMELHQFLGESARDIGLRNKVSLGIDPDFVDGKGNRYGEAIVHSAVTPVPVVPGQGGYEAVEMGQSEANGIEILALSLVESDSIPSPSPGTPGEGRGEGEFERRNLHNISNHPHPNPLPDYRERGPDGEQQHHKLNEISSPVEAPRKIDLQLAITALTDALIAKRDLAVARGGVDPSVANELFALLSNRELLLSRSQNNAPLALAVFDALSRNRPVPLGETTSLQVLSRLVPSMDSELATLQERMIALASGASV